MENRTQQWPYRTGAQPAYRVVRGGRSRDPGAVWQTLGAVALLGVALAALMLFPVRRPIPEAPAVLPSGDIISVRVSPGKGIPDAAGHASTYVRVVPPHAPVWIESPPPGLFRAPRAGSSLPGAVLPHQGAPNLLYRRSGPN